MKAVENKIKSLKFFNTEWVTTGRNQVSSEILDDNCSEIESQVSIEKILDYYNKNKYELKALYFEISNKISLYGFCEFIIYQFGMECNTPYNDGGNVTYILSARF